MDQELLNFITTIQNQESSTVTALENSVDLLISSLNSCIAKVGLNQGTIANYESNSFYTDKDVYALANISELFYQQHEDNKDVYDAICEAEQNLKDTAIPVAQFTAEGGYYFKILSDARKIVFVYAGASALAGYESVNWGEKVLHDGSTLHDRDAFIYGGALTLDVEFYVADRIALLANLRERLLWGGDTRKFHTQFGAGVKIIIN